MTHAVTFWMPELLNPQRIKEAESAWTDLKLPALRYLLKRADVFPTQGLNKGASGNFYDTACQLYQQPQTLPVAAVLASRQLASFDTRNYWVKIDPVQLVPDRDTLVLIPGKDLGVEEEEAKSLISAFNRHFSQDRVEIEYGSPLDWYIRIKQPVDLHTTALNEVTYASLENHFPQGHAAQYWRQLLNEASMLFFDHPVNQKRREAGQPEINGLWLWGEGQLNRERITVRPQASVWSEEPYLCGMASLCQSFQSPFPENAEEWLNRLEGEERHHLLLSDDLLSELENMTLSAWLESLQWLEEWMSVLLRGVKERKIGSLLLELGDGCRYHIQPKHLNYFWRFKNRI